MNENRIAQRARLALDAGSSDLKPAVSRRLEAARHLALSRQKQPAHQWITANARNGNGLILHARPYVRQGLAILALLLGMAIAFYWQNAQYVNELEEIDSALLSDDLPPAALLDNDFLQWLLDDSQEP